MLASYGHVRDLPRQGRLGAARRTISPCPGRSTTAPRSASRRSPSAVKGAEHLYPRHRPGSRGRGDLLACAGGAAAAQGAEGRRRQARRLQRDHQAGGARRVQASARARPASWSTPISRAARSTISSASRSRRCCGASCRAAARPAACSRWRCASSASAKPRSKPSRRANTGRSRPSSRRRQASASPPASPISTARSSTSSTSTSEAKARDAADADRAPAPASPSRSVEKKQVRRNPPPPFTTSTLQQEASRKLGFGAPAHHAHRAAAL